MEKGITGKSYTGWILLEVNEAIASRSLWQKCRSALESFALRFSLFC